MNGGYQSSLFQSNSSSVAQPSPGARIFLSTANVASDGGLENVSIGDAKWPHGYRSQGATVRLQTRGPGARCKGCSLDQNGRNCHIHSP
jgi:hypothetical protein